MNLQTNLGARYLERKAVIRSNLSTVVVIYLMRITRYLNIDVDRSMKFKTMLTEKIVS